MGWLVPYARTGIPVRYAQRESDPTQDRELALNGWMRAQIASRPYFLSDLQQMLVPEARGGILMHGHDMLARLLGTIANRTNFGDTRRNAEHVLSQYLDRREMGGWNPHHQAYLSHTPTGADADIMAHTLHHRGFGGTLATQGTPITLASFGMKGSTATDQQHEQLGQLLQHTFGHPYGILHNLASLQSHAMAMRPGSVVMPVHRFLSQLLSDNMGYRKELGTGMHDRLKDFGWHPDEVSPSEQHFGH